MAGYIGSTPVPQATQHRETFTATNNQTSFATVGYTPQFLDVYLNGVKLAPADFTATNGSDVILASGATTNDILEVVAYTPFEVANQTFTGTTTIANLTATGTTTLAGASTSADITFGDNDKAIFGVGSDLQIYHNSTNSFITNAKGTLYINQNENDADVRIRTDNSSGGITEYIKAEGSTGEVQLYHYGDEKLATKSTGINVTGTVTADGLTVDGNATISSISPTLVLEDIDGAAQDDARLQVGASVFNIKRDNDNLSRLTVGLSTGDISFFDTSGNAKFFWDASASALGIGTTSFPSSPNKLAIQGNQGASGSNINIAADELFIDNAGDTGMTLGSSNTGTGYYAFADSDVALRSGLFYDHSTDDMGFRVASSTRMTIDSSGNVGIGTNSPSHLLDVEGSGDASIRIGSTGSGDADAFIHIDGADTGESAVYFETDGVGGAFISMTGGAGGDLNIATEPSSGRNIDLQPHNTLTMRVVTPASGTNTTEIIEFFADSTSAGKISAMDGDLVIGEDAVGIKFENTGTDRIIPVNVDTLATRSAAIDLGGSAERFKDLYLSGGVFLGGTGSGNHLDDYEFGFFEPTYTSSGTNPSGITYDPTVGNEGRYTKIGGVVHIQINIRTDAISNKGTGNLLISGLPFASGAYSSQGGISVLTCQAAGFLNNQPSAAQIGESSTEITLMYRPTSDGDVQAVATSSLNTFSNDNLIRISGTYMTEE